MNPTPALDWLSRGVAVFPVLRNKQPALSTWKRYQTELPTAGQVHSWLRCASGYAVVTGWQGLVVIDFDDLARYEAWRAAHPKEACTRSVRTGRGVHCYFWSAAATKTQHAPGVDVIARGAYVLGEGSQHPSGATYTVLDKNASILRIDCLSPLLSASSEPTRATEHALSSRGGEDRDPMRGTYDPLREAKRARAVDLVPGNVTATGPGWGAACCPLHDDGHPSLIVNQHTGDVRCLAGCNGGRWMDGIRFYALLHGTDDRRAIHELAGLERRGP